LTTGLLTGFVYSVQNVLWVTNIYSLEEFW
jgi:hypothetical protein